MNTLQNHIKAKYNRQQIFCPHRDLNVLTNRLSKIICNDTLFEKEVGIRKERVGIAYIDTIEAIRFDMDRYIQSKFTSSNIFEPSVSNIPLFSLKTPLHDDGTYVMIGIDHGQGTAQFMMRILLSDSSDRCQCNRPDYNTRDINYATIKCKKDPYEILKLTMDETNRCIRHLSTHKLVTFSNTSSTVVRTLFVNVKCNTLSINNNLLSASGPGIGEVYE